MAFPKPITDFSFTTMGRVSHRNPALRLLGKCDTLEKSLRDLAFDTLEEMGKMRGAFVWGVTAEHMTRVTSSARQTLSRDAENNYRDLD